MTEEAEPIEPIGWNLLVTTCQGEQRAVRRALAGLVCLRPSGYRNVLLGRADDPQLVLSGIAELIAGGILHDHQFGRILPVEHTFCVDAANLDAQLRTETASVLPRLAHRRFYVRITRRGHKGIIDAMRSERALGDHLGSELERRGEYAGVDFRDPDVVLAVELIGDLGGIALVSRELRQRFPFVHID